MTKGVGKMRLLRFGNRGEDVKDVQKALKALAYSPNGADGIFGERTLLAVKNFQKDHGLFVDGVVGEKTRKMLFGGPYLEHLEDKYCESMKVDNVDIIKHFEGLYLEPYYCVAGKLTVGYGNLSHAIEGVTITEEQAEQYLREDIKWCEDTINTKVTAPLKQCEFDALVAFVFNIGSGAFSKSTLLKKLNSGDKEGAAKEFKRWNKVNKKVVVGLTRRRKSEAHLFTTGEVDFFE